MNQQSQINALNDTVETVARTLNELEVQWMMFGGAAMVLHGFEDPPVKDIYIVVSAASAAKLKRRHHWDNYADAAIPQFRSQYVFRPAFGPVPIEILGGFRILNAHRWVDIEPKQPRKIEVKSQSAYVAPLPLLAEIFRLCGRERDLQRKQMINVALGSAPA